MLSILDEGLPLAIGLLSLRRRTPRRAAAAGCYTTPWTGRMSTLRHSSGPRPTEGDMGGDAGAGDEHGGRRDVWPWPANE
jgi:hypothetical protein